MAGKSTISITFKLDGDTKEFKELITDADGLKKVFQATIVQSDNLKKSLMNWSQGVQAITAITDTLSTVSSALSQFSDRMKGLQSENIAITQLTGKTGEEMAKLRNNVQAVSEYFGTGFNETLRAANALSKGFGISMEDAMKLVQDGLVSGANAGGDFIDTVREYPRYFKEAGLSADNFIAIATNAAQQGVFSDKGVDVIKEGNLRIREMTAATADALNGIGISAEKVQADLQAGSITTFDVMQMVAAKLNELPASSSAVGTAIADIFGGPGEDAGLEYIKTLANVQLNMDAVKAATQGTAEQQEQQIQTQENLKNGLLGLIDLSAIYTDVKPYVDLTAQIGMAAMGIGSLIKTVKAMNIQYRLYQARALAAKAATVLFGRSVSAATTATAGMGTAMRTSSVAATRLATALRAAFITTGIGIVIAGVTAAIAALTGKAEEARSQVGGMGEEASRAASGLSQAENAFAQAAASAKVEIDNDAKALRALIDAKADTAEAVQRLNDKYGSSFGTYQTAAEWYDTLTQKAAAYARTIGYTAKMEDLSRQIAEKELKLEENRHKQAEFKKNNPATVTIEARNRTAEGGRSVPMEVTNPKLMGLESEESGLQMELKALNAELALTQELAGKAGVALRATLSGTGGSGTPAAPPAAVNPKATTIAEMQANVKALQALQAKASEDEIAGINQSIALWEAKIRVMQRAGMVQHDALNPKGMKDMGGLSSLLEGEQRAVNQTSIAWEGYSLSQSKAKEDAPAMNEQLVMLGGAMRNLGGAVGGQAAEWLNWAGTLLGSIAQALPAIAQLIGGNIAQAFAGSIAQSQTVPFPANIVALAASLAAVGAAVASIPKFAEGGIVSGPTLAMVGEYAGASGNPEVIAPLDKLRGMLAQPASMDFGKVEFEIKGRTLVGILSKENNIIRRN